MKKLPGIIENALLLSILVLLLLQTASSVPYCLLRAPYDPPQGNCFQFYLADTATSPARATVAGGVCDVTPLAAREGWGPDPTFPGPLSTWASGDAAMGVVSPYFDDVYGCHAAAGGNNAGVGNGGGNGTGNGQLTLDVSGKWNIQSSYGSNTPFPMDMELTQSGTSVSGTYNKAD